MNLSTTQYPHVIIAGWKVNQPGEIEDTLPSRLLTKRKNKLIKNKM